MADETEPIRREMVTEINAEPKNREQLEAECGEVWDTNELRWDFEVLGFLAPLIAVRRRSDGKKGSLMFQHEPRLYFGWSPD